MNQVNSSISTILIVDDNPANLNLLMQILIKRGYKVRVAPNGKLALKSVEFSPPDLILLDIRMPDMNGYEVCRYLKENEQTRHIPTIFISALDATLDKVHAFSAGGCDYITKPFESREVIARVENQLRLRQYQLELQAQNAQLQLLLSTTQAINEASDVSEALTAVLAQVCQTINWDFGEAWLLNSQGNNLERNSIWLNQKWGLSPDVQSSCYSCLTRELSEQILLSQKLAYLENFNRPMKLTWEDNQMSQIFEVKTALGVPILFEGQVLAILIFLCQNLVLLSLRSLDLVNAVATQLGAMIQRKKAEASLKQANYELKRLATLDGLTQLANRRQFDEYFEREWQRLAREEQPLSLILFDIDHFKRYNDYYGHLAGDDCLQQVAKAANHAVQRPSDLVARYGGEEFAAILPDTEIQGALVVAQMIREQIQQLKLPHASSPSHPYLTLSLGVSGTIPSLERSPDYLIALADAALYEAKNQGRDRIVLKPDVA